MITITFTFIVPCRVGAQNYMYYFQKLIRIPKKIPADARKIYLNNNDISDIESGVFAENTKCRNLRLDRNRLIEIKKDMWIGLVALEYLSLEHNDIKIIHPYAFADLTNLKGLYLDNNKLTTLPRNIFPLKQIVVLETLTLHGNKLKRDELGWLVVMCDDGEIEQYTIRGDDITCSTNNSHDKRSAVRTSTQLIQGEPSIVVYTAWKLVPKYSGVSFWTLNCQIWQYCVN